MLHAARHGDYGPLIFYVIAVIFCLMLVLDMGNISSRIEQRLKSGVLGPQYKWIPTWLFRCSPLLGLALITAVFLTI